MDKKLLEFEQVTGLYGKFRLKEVDFSVPAGYICGLMGSNGAGKTTLFRYIMEEIKYKGSIRVDGEDIQENRGFMKNKIGFVSEDNTFLKECTAKQNAELLKGFYEEFDMEGFLNTLEEMRISPNRIYGKMSRGEAFKFQMAFAMAHRPVLYLLDEVTVGMDPVFREEFFTLLQHVIADGQASVVMTSHIESELERKADYIGVMEEGRMVRFGESIELLK